MSQDCWRSEKIFGTFGYQIVGDRFPQDMRGGIEGSFGLDLNHSFSIGCNDLSDHAPLVWADLAGGNAVGSDGELTAATEGVESGALGLDAVTGVGMFEEGNGLPDVGVTFAID